MPKKDYDELYNAIHSNRSGLGHIDKHVFVKMYGYKDAQDYYSSVSVANWTSQISVPVFALHARDDPITPHAFTPFKDIEAKNSKIMYSSTSYGGHACHMIGTLLPSTWYQEPCMEFLNFMEEKHFHLQKTASN